MFDPDRFYRPTEVWKETHAAREQVYEALRSGELRAIRRGRRWLIPGSAASAWLDGALEGPRSVRSCPEISRLGRARG